MSIDVTTFSLLNSYTLFTGRNAIIIRSDCTFIVNDGKSMHGEISGSGTIIDNRVMDNIIRVAIQLELNQFILNVNNYFASKTPTSITAINQTLNPGCFNANINIPPNTTITFTLNDPSNTNAPFIFKCNLLQMPFDGSGFLNFEYAPNVSQKNIILLIKDSQYAICNFISFKGVILVEDDYSASGKPLFFGDTMNGKIYANSEIWIYNNLTLSDNLECFAEHTKILTPSGYVNVEDLRVGDFVLTEGVVENNLTFCGTEKGAKQIELSRSLSCFVTDQEHAPVRISAGALGDQLPTEDLYLSRNHGVIVDGILVPVHKLINGTTIEHDFTRKTVQYCHLKLHVHSVIVANGVMCESYLEMEK